MKIIIDFFKYAKKNLLDFGKSGFISMKLANDFSIFDKGWFDIHA